MKLIIDIPDEVLESRHYCQYFGAWSTKLTETIENGKPYEETQGEWIKVKEERMSVDMPGEIVTRYKCSKCGRVIATFPNKLAEYYPFCHCGAKMKGGC